jgi:hypothetical protein
MYFIEECLVYTFFGLVINYIAGAVVYLHCPNTPAVDKLP